jgi:phosphohistidine swiveling domain-containing protein
MTILTGIGRGNMGDGFTRRYRAIMATNTITGDTAVVKLSIPSIGAVTVFTNIIAGNMIRRFTLSYGAVMTTKATA